jgi:hypothetical protein
MYCDTHHEELFAYFAPEAFEPIEIRDALRGEIYLVDRTLIW